MLHIIVSCNLSFIRSDTLLWPLWHAHGAHRSRWNIYIHKINKSNRKQWFVLCQGLAHYVAQTGFGFWQTCFPWYWKYRSALPHLAKKVFKRKWGVMAQACFFSLCCVHVVHTVLFIHSREWPQVHALGAWLQDDSGVGPHLLPNLRQGLFYVCWFACFFFLAALARITDLRASRIPPPPPHLCLLSPGRSARITDMCYCMWIFEYSGIQTQVCVVGALPTEPSSWPCK